MKFGTTPTVAMTFAVNSRANLSASSGVSAGSTPSGVITSNLPEPARCVIVANVVALVVEVVLSPSVFICTL